MESWHNAVDEKNMQRQKVSSFQDYPVDLGIGADLSLIHILKNGDRVFLAKQKYNDFVTAYMNYLRKA